ncbi:MAG: hypothetical protein R6T83_04405 [Salinibacter sp.]
MASGAEEDPSHPTLRVFRIKYTVNFVFTGMSELKIPEIQHVISSKVEKSP